MKQVCESANQAGARILEQILARAGLNPYVIIGYGAFGLSLRVDSAKRAVERTLERLEKYGEHRQTKGATQEILRVQNLILFAPPLELHSLLSLVDSNVDIDIYMGRESSIESMELFASCGVVRYYKDCKFM